MRDTPKIVGRTGAMWDESCGGKKKAEEGELFRDKEGGMEAQVIDGGVGGDGGRGVLMWSLRQGRVK